MSDTIGKDIQDLARFGYRQDLDRSLGAFSSFAASFSYISILTGVSQMFYMGFAAAGPAFFWTWPVVLLGQFSVALGFAELAAQYPLSGGVYQWSRRVGSPALGWLTGWIYLACSVISLAAVALALQATLPQIDGGFQMLGDGSNPEDRAWNAVVLGCGLIALTTMINVIGVRLMARINNVGVISEMAGVVLLIILLFACSHHEPALLLRRTARSGAYPRGWIGALLASAVMPSYVLYGFDTAGTLAEETTDPRRRAPWAILRALAAAGLTGGLLIAAAILAARDPSAAALGEISGGLPMIVNDALGRRLGGVFLSVVVFSIMVCALAVHAGTVRLIFAMARDNGLPFAHALSRVTDDTKTPPAPAFLTGVLAALILFVNANLPKMIETLCSVAIIWANLAYLLVSLPLLFRRLRGWPANLPEGACLSEGTFTLGRWGLPVNLVAVAWGTFTVVNMSWPRPEIYGDNPSSRFAAIYATAALVGAGILYYLAFQRDQTKILVEHRAKRRGWLRKRRRTKNPSRPGDESTTRWELMRCCR
ncbi:MAG: amino acid permease [Isosphaeraceae bacterium]